MVTRIPVDKLYHTTVVTRDLEAMARNYTRFYGIEQWDVVDHTSDRLESKTVHGRRPSRPAGLELEEGDPIPNDYSFRAATGTTANGAIRFQLVEPTSGLSTFEEFYVARGQGVHSLCVAHVAPSDIQPLIDWLAGEGVPVAMSFTFGGADHYYFDTRAKLGYFYIEVVVPHGDAEASADEVWRFADQAARPDNLSFTTQVGSIPHFGVVVEDLTARLANFARLFGEPVWRGMHWNTAEGSLEDTTNNGVPVKHGYFTGRANVGPNLLGAPFGFEVIQPTYGPSHYKEDFLQPLGAGIHHIDLQWPIAEWSQWHEVNGWLSGELDAPTCMSGWLRNRLTVFHYQDTRAKLGYVSEIHPPRRSSNAKLWAPDYWYDFSHVIAA